MCLTTEKEISKIHHPASGDKNNLQQKLHKILKENEALKEEAKRTKAEVQKQKLRLKEAEERRRKAEVVLEQLMRTVADLKANIRKYRKPNAVKQNGPFSKGLSYLFDR